MRGLTWEGLRTVPGSQEAPCPWSRCARLPAEETVAADAGLLAFFTLLSS